MLLVTTVFARAAFSHLQINPQILLKVITLSDTLSESNFSANVGYSIDADLKFGVRFQIQPGAHWFHSSTAVKTREGEFEAKDELVRQYVKLKVLVASDLADDGAFKLRVNAGPTYDFLVNVEDNDF